MSHCRNKKSKRTRRVNRLKGGTPTLPPGTVVYTRTGTTPPRPTVDPTLYAVVKKPKSKPSPIIPIDNTYESVSNLYVLPGPSSTIPIDNTYEQLSDSPTTSIGNNIYESVNNLFNTQPKGITSRSKRKVVKKNAKKA